jgi:hypothetical protein
VTSYELANKVSIPGRGQFIPLLSIAFRPILRPTQPPVGYILSGICQEARRQRRQANNPSPSHDEARNSGAVCSPLQCLHGQVLHYINRYKDNFISSHISLRIGDCSLSEEYKPNDLCNTDCHFWELSTGSLNELLEIFRGASGFKELPIREYSSLSACMLVSNTSTIRISFG